MTLYQVVDENNLMTNEYQELGMAQCHLEIMKKLYPNHNYHINVLVFEEKTKAPPMWKPI